MQFWQLQLLYYEPYMTTSTLKLCLFGDTTGTCRAVVLLPEAGLVPLPPQLSSLFARILEREGAQPLSVTGPEFAQQQQLVEWEDPDSELGPEVSCS